ncbi:hypothetical protein SDC9_188450 [bioreactor metagenome]|uniref:Uncharacterized protein n=1 Tax=bioreactor metagenome TaxID=1076179 RepID=A0A645HPY5_9ZZZZ
MAVEAIITTTAGDTSLASTAACPTTTAPTMDKAWPMVLGSLIPASTSISKAIRSPKVSIKEGKGTPSLEICIDKASCVGIIS